MPISNADILRGEAQRTSIRLMKVEPGTLFPEVAIVQVLHVLTEDSGLNLSGDLDSAHRAPDLLHSPHGGNLLTIQLGVVLIPVAQNFLLEVKLLRGSSKSVSGSNSMLLVAEEAVGHDITPGDSVNLTSSLKTIPGFFCSGHMVIGDGADIISSEKIAVKMKLCVGMIFGHPAPVVAFSTLVTLFCTSPPSSDILMDNTVSCIGVSSFEIDA